MLIFSKRPDDIIPAMGAGVLTINFPRYRTIPPSPLTLRYFDSLNEKSAPAFTGSAHTSGSLKDEMSNQSDINFQRLFFFPESSNLLSISDSTITLENFPFENKDTNPSNQLRLLNNPRIAKRGQPWSFLPIIRGVAFKNIKIVEGPEHIRIDPKDGISWHVPDSYIDDTASVKISVGDKELKIPISILGSQVAIFTTPQSNSPQGVAISKTFQFPEVIDKIIPIPSKSKALILSGKNRKLSLFDFKTSTIVNTYHPSTGAVVAAIGPNAIFIWHLNGNLLEKRDIQTLKPLKIASTTSVFPVRALIGGAVPMVLFEQDNAQLVMYEIDPEALDLSEPIVLPHFHTNYLKAHHNINYLPQSTDGKQFLLNNRMTRKLGPLNYSTDIISSSLIALHGNPTYLTPDGTSLISNGMVLDLANNRAWSTNAKNDNAILIPDISASKIISLRDETDKDPYLKIYDLSTQKHLATLTGLTELSDHFSKSFGSALASSKLIYDSQTGTLISLNKDATLLFLRNIGRMGKD